MIAFACGQPQRRAPAHPSLNVEDDDGFYRPVPRSPPAPHACPALEADSPLRALEPRNELIAGCPSDVQLRPGNYGWYAVAFSCPDAPGPTIFIRGLGAEPFPRPVRPIERPDYEAVQMGRFAEASDGAYASYFFAGKGKPPPCATHQKGLKMVIFDYRKVDRAVEGIVRLLLHDDLDAEIMLEIRPDPADWKSPKAPPR